MRSIYMDMKTGTFTKETRRGTWENSRHPTSISKCILSRYYRLPAAPVKLWAFHRCQQCRCHRFQCQRLLEILTVRCISVRLCVCVWSCVPVRQRGSVTDRSRASVLDDPQPVFILNSQSSLLFHRNPELFLPCRHGLICFHSVVSEVPRYYQYSSLCL